MKALQGVPGNSVEPVVDTGLTAPTQLVSAATVTINAQITPAVANVGGGNDDKERWMAFGGSPDYDLRVRFVHPNSAEIAGPKSPFEQDEYVISPGKTLMLKLVRGGGPYFYEVAILGNEQHPSGGLPCICPDGNCL